jgi:predicted RNase H-like nuclease (RuvC/YqgF family)
MDSENQGLKLLLKSYQEGRAELEAEARFVVLHCSFRELIICVRRKSKEIARTLEIHLSLAHKKTAEASDKKTSALARASEIAYSDLKKTNERLREENANLMDELEELREMVEILKARDKPGLISDPSSSPRMPMFSK